MKRMFIQKCLLVSISLVSLAQAMLDHTSVPKLTVIFVIDQFAHHYLNTLSPHLHYGLKQLMEKGICYDSAYMPHGIPSTGPGHASLNTGAYPKDHGIIGNKWRDKNGNKTACDDDASPDAAVIAPNGFYEHGKSPHNIMVNGISDTFMYTSSPAVPHHVYSIASKSRAAICTANNAKALWLDEKTGNFTSSKFYFKDGQLPMWLNDFNKKSGVPHLKGYTWHLAYSRTKRPYNFYDTNNYLYSRPARTFIGHTKIMDEDKKADFYEYLEKTPGMADITFNVARSCVDAHVSREKKDKMMLWVCISNLDKIGHTFGSNSIETLDTIYHLDRQIAQFMKYVQRKVGDKNVLFVLTADHGMAPTPEIARARGLAHANRIVRADVMQEFNGSIHKNHEVEECVSSISGPNVYLDQAVLEKISPDKRVAIAQHVKEMLLKKPFVKNAWTYEQLANANFCCNQEIECSFKNQLFPGRSGSVIFQTYPNNFVTTYKKGADHKTPYEQDTHIPLIIYQPGRFEQKMIVKKVYAQQLAPTLATILRVPKPDVNPFEVLPGLFDAD